MEGHSRSEILRAGKSSSSPTYAYLELLTEIIRIDDFNFYLLGAVEMSIKALDGRAKAWKESLVARGSREDHLQIVKSLGVGSMVHARFYFKIDEAEWIVRSVRRPDFQPPRAAQSFPGIASPANTRSSSLLRTGSIRPSVAERAAGYPEHLIADFNKVAASIVIQSKPFPGTAGNLGVKIHACGVVLGLTAEPTYYHNSKLVPFLQAKKFLEAKGAGFPVLVDVKLAGSTFTLMKVKFETQEEQALQLGASSCASSQQFCLEAQAAAQQLSSYERLAEHLNSAASVAAEAVAKFAAAAASASRSQLMSPSDEINQQPQVDLQKLMMQPPQPEAPDQAAQARTAQEPSASLAGLDTGYLLAIKRPSSPLAATSGDEACSNSPRSQRSTRAASTSSRASTASTASTASSSSGPFSSSKKGKQQPPGTPSSSPFKKPI